MAARTDTPLELGDTVVVRLPEPSLIGFAYVRRCSRSGNEYLIGLEFREPLVRERDETSTWDRKRVEGGQGSAWEGWDD